MKKVEIHRYSSKFKDTWVYTRWFEKSNLKFIKLEKNSSILNKLLIFEM